MIERIYIGLGSNIDPESNIAETLRRLAGQAPILALSTFYRSPAEGDADGPPFINGAAEIATGLGPEEVKWDLLRPIEDALGRVRTADKNSPRTIDLDLLLYGTRIANTPRLTLPNPDIVRYPFVAVPLLELAPHLVWPAAGAPLRVVTAAMAPSGLVPLPEYSMRLKRQYARR